MIKKIFSANEQNFEEISFEIFSFQYKNNRIYQEFCDFLKKTPKNVSVLEKIPFIPVEFFKNHPIFCGNTMPETIFTSSGTTSEAVSKHFVKEISVYEESFRRGFEFFYQNPQNYTILALLPSYLEREGSSLIYMVEDLIKASGKKHSGFYLHNTEQLAKTLKELDEAGEKILLIGVSFALLDLVEKHQFNLKNTIVMETGGMKGRRKELIRSELHKILTEGFGTKKIHSEYGMTELLSQGYSFGNGIFKSVPWLKILIRETQDPFSFCKNGKIGGVNLIDLANIYSCSFLQTQDLGKKIDNHSFEILGRFDASDIRGCNLMVS